MGLCLSAAHLGVLLCLTAIDYAVGPRAIEPLIMAWSLPASVFMKSAGPSGMTLILANSMAWGFGATWAWFRLRRRPRRP